MAEFPSRWKLCRDLNRRGGRVAVRPIAPSCYGIFFASYQIAAIDSTKPNPSVMSRNRRLLCTGHRCHEQNCYANDMVDLCHSVYSQLCLGLISH